ncbi:ABC transporter permease [Azospirillum melinis]|uniref:ABC transporter permease n=1 Tax=Azospirillum melinis TaxID=328839 RepID=A0ABX2KAK3_9PROT|nr:simple sugar transport system permease protein [Azospirillum melinis]NUB00633.1 ABC transporter permease [Azospirillum melinis]
MLLSGSGKGQPGAVPGWVGYALLPVLNLVAAFVLSGLVILVIGENPVDVLSLLLSEALGYPEAIGYTLYYTTDYIFTGLAVAIAFHCGLFNIGGEGQAYLGGLGAGLVALALTGWPWPVVAVLAVLASALFGAAWAFIPAWLQAKRGSHIVITTIMFNFIAASIMTWLLVDVLIRPGSQSPETREFDPGVWLPSMDRALGWFGIAIPASPLNLSFLWALACCLLFHIFLRRTRWGYELRTVGRNERAAVYAGISPARNIVIAMLISGALAGFVGVNEILGVQHRVILNFTGGVGFVGIAVALMGRNHPVGIILAALLFGVLAQGGGQLSFEYPTINRELVMVIQGLVILFAGAMENLFKPQVEALFRRRGAAAAAADAATGGRG